MKLDLKMSLSCWLTKKSPLRSLAQVSAAFVERRRGEVTRRVSKQMGMRETKASFGRMKTVYRKGEGVCNLRRLDTKAGDFKEVYPNKLEKEYGE